MKNFILVLIVLSPTLVMGQSERRMNDAKETMKQGGAIYAAALAPFIATELEGNGGNTVFKNKNYPSPISLKKIEDIEKTLRKVTQKEAIGIFYQTREMVDKRPFKFVWVYNSKQAYDQLLDIHSKGGSIHSISGNSFKLQTKRVATKTLRGTSAVIGILGFAELVYGVSKWVVAHYSAQDVPALGTALTITDTHKKILNSGRDAGKLPNRGVATTTASRSMSKQK